jgi:hypothetical protein
MLLAVILIAAPPLVVDVSVNGVESSRTCRLQHLQTDAEARSGEALDWDQGQGVDLRIICRRSTGSLIRVVKGVSGKRSINIKMGFVILWTVRDGDNFSGRFTLKRLGGAERVKARAGAQIPLTTGTWEVQTFDDEKKGWRSDRLVINQGVTLEKTLDLAPGKLRVSVASGKALVEVIGADGRSAGYGPAGAWIELPPNRYDITVTREEDLAQIGHPLAAVVLRPNAALERSANPILGILRWRLSEKLGELKILDAEGEKVLAEHLTGSRWKIAPGRYRVAYRLPSSEIVGLEFGARSEPVEVHAGRATSFGERPRYGSAVVRLRRGPSPQFGKVELLNPADGEIAGRFAIGQMVRIALGRWPLRVVASDGVIIAYAKPLVIRENHLTQVDLQRRQSRLRVTLRKNGKRARGGWNVHRDDEEIQAVSGEALDLDAGVWSLRVRCAGGRGVQEKKVTLRAGADLEEELLCP